MNMRLILADIVHFIHILLILFVLVGPFILPKNLARYFELDLTNKENFICNKSF